MVWLEIELGFAALAYTVTGETGSHAGLLMSAYCGELPSSLHSCMAAISAPSDPEATVDDICSISANENLVASLASFKQSSCVNSCILDCATRWP